jgi:hypothetical protein
VAPANTNALRPGRIVLVIFGAIAALVGLGLLAGGGVLVWAHATQRDSAGFYATSAERFATSTYALTSDRLDFGTHVRKGDWTPFDEFGTARITAEMPGGEVFVGIGPSVDVARYLAASAHDQVTRVSFAPFRPTYWRFTGEASPSVPASQSFWVASASGVGRQTLLWPLEDGDWTVVVMNADSTAGVSVDASAAIKTPVLLPVGLGLATVGLVLLAGAAVMLVVGLRRSNGDTGSTWQQSPASVAISAPGAYPARLSGRLDPPVSRWLWLVKWLLVIPHLVVLALLWVAVMVLTLVAGFTILFTGRYPRSIFDFNVGVMRWTWRVSFYAISAFGTDRYPPFSLQPHPDYPADFTVDYPQRLSRGLVLVKWWLLALPHYLVVGVFAGGWVFGWTDERPAVGGGLIAILAVIAAVILTATGRYPQQLFDFVMGLNRWCYRVLAYAALMRDEYPPFRLDMGGGDPGTPAAPTPSTASGPGGDLAAVGGVVQR